MHSTTMTRGTDGGNLSHPGCSSPPLGHSGTIRLDRRSSISPQPTCWNDLVMVGHGISRSPVKAFFASRRSPSSSFAANVQVTLLPLQHSHLEPSFSDFLKCSMCSVQTVDLHCCNIDHRLVLIYSLLKYLSLPLKCCTPFEKPLSVSSHGHISIV